MANNKNFKVKNSVEAANYLPKTGTPTISASVDSSGIYTGKALSTAPSDPSTHYAGPYFRPDGPDVYWLDYSADTIYQRKTASDLEAYFGKGYFTGNINNVSFSSIPSAAAGGFSFKADGTRLYVQNRGTIYTSVLSTAWDLSTAGTFSSGNGFTSPWGTFPYGLQFKPDGTQVYAAPNNTNTIVKVNLSSAWSLNYSGYTTYTFSEITTRIFSFSFSEDGTVLYIVAYTSAAIKILRYDLSTAWNLGTRGADTYTQDYPAASISYGISFVSDDVGKIVVGDMVYSTKKETVSVNPYDASYFDTSSLNYSVPKTTFNFNALYNKPFSFLLSMPNTPGVSGSDYFAQTTYSKFTDNTTGGSQASVANAYRFSITKGGNYAIWQDNGDLYTDTTAMTTPYDLSTLPTNNTTRKYFDLSAVTGEATSAVIMDMSPDGTQVITFTRQQSAPVRLYTLSTPYDVSTASLTSSISQSSLASSSSSNFHSTNLACSYVQWLDDGNAFLLVCTGGNGNGDQSFKWTVTSPYTLSGYSYDGSNPSQINFDETGHFSVQTDAGVTSELFNNVLYFPTAWDIGDNPPSAENYRFEDPRSENTDSITPQSLGFISSLRVGYVVSKNHFVVGPYNGFATVKTGLRPQIEWPSMMYWNNAPTLVNSTSHNAVFAIQSTAAGNRYVGSTFFTEE